MHGLGHPQWRHGRTCRFCGGRKKLTRHHVRKYRRIVLCRKHHASVHRLADLGPLVFIRVVIHSIMFRFTRRSTQCHLNQKDSQYSRSSQ